MAAAFAKVADFCSYGLAVLGVGDVNHFITVSSIVLEAQLIDWFIIIITLCFGWNRNCLTATICSPFESVCPQAPRPTSK